MSEESPHARLLQDLSSDQEEVRKFAVIGLSETGDPKIQSHLERMTRDRSPAVRYFARTGLNKLLKRQRASQPSAWDRALTEAALDDVDLAAWRRNLADVDPRRRLEAVMAAERIVDPAIYVVLQEALASEADVRVQATLLKAIARFRRPESFKLIEGFMASSDSRVRANAVEALDVLAHRAAKPLLEPLLEDADNRVRGNALKAMARFDRSRALKGAEDMSRSPRIWMRATAVWLLRQLGGDDSARLLRQMLRKESGEMSEKILDALKDLSEQGSLVASDALGTRESGVHRVPEAQANPRPEKVEDLLGSESYRERIEAVQATVNLAREQAAALLRELLQKEEHHFVIATAIKILGQVGASQDIQLISGYLTHPDARIRANAIEGLAATGKEAVYALIEPLLADPNNRVRANAARVMAAKDSDRAFGALKDMLLAPDPILADSALFALKKIGTDQILEVLEIGLQHNSQEVQLKVMKVLELLGQENDLARQLHEKYRERGTSGQWVAEPLENVLSRMNDPDAAIRMAALEKLSHFPRTRARSRIRLATRDKDVRVRDRALELVQEADIEERRRAYLTNLGLASYRTLKDKAEEFPELQVYRERILEASDRLDRGNDMADSLSMRREQVLALGERVFVMFESGRVEDPGLTGICRLIVELETERDRRRSRASQAASDKRGPVLEGVPPALWGVLVLALCLMVAGWFLMPGSDGPLVWRRGKTAPGRLTVSGDLLLAAEAGGNLVAYRKRTGSIFWTTAPGRGEMHAPVVSGERVYVADDGGVVSGFRLDTGERSSSTQLQGRILAPPVVTPDAIYVLISRPPSGADVVLLDPRSGSEIRRDDLGSGEGQALAVTPTLELAILGERLVAVERASGSKLWEYRAESRCRPYPGPIPFEDQVLIGTGRSILSVDGTGALDWSQAPSDPVALDAGPFLWGRTLIVPAGGRLWMMAAESGISMGSHGISRDIRYARLTGNRFVYSPGDRTLATLFLESGKKAILSGIGGDIHDLAVEGDMVYVSTDRGLLALRMPEPE